MRENAQENRAVLIRLTVLFAALSTALVPLDEIGALGQSIRLGLSILLSSAFSGMVAAMVCLPGKHEESSELWASVRPVLSRLIWATLIVTVAVTLSIILIVVPFILATIWAVVVPVIVVERSTALGSLPRSQEIIRGNGWRVFGFLVCLALITLGVLLFSLILALPFGTGLAGLMISNFILVCVAYPLLLSGPAVLYSELTRPVRDPMEPEPAEEAEYPAE